MVKIDFLFNLQYIGCSEVSISLRGNPKEESATTSQRHEDSEPNKYSGGITLSITSPRSFVRVSHSLIATPAS